MKRRLIKSSLSAMHHHMVLLMSQLGEMITFCIWWWWCSCIFQLPLPVKLSFRGYRVQGSER